MLRKGAIALAPVALLVSASGCIGLLGDFTVSHDSALEGPDAGALPDANIVETSAPDVEIEDGDAADAMSADVSISDTSAPDASTADVAIPDSAVPDSAIPDSAGPDAATFACATPIVDAWTADFGQPGNPWRSAFGNPSVDTTSQRLHITYDDIVERQTPLDGSYVVSHDVTLTGGTVFTPSVLVADALLPSMRRDGADIQLGGDAYAGAWSDAQPTGFAGRRIPGALTARVTTYVKAALRQLAVKVEAGGVVIRSGWTAPFTWPQTNMAMFRLIGENNSSIYGGTDDSVYVGPLTICAGLDDADIDLAYAQ